MRSLYYALGSLDGVNLACAFQSYGSTTGPSRMPDSTVASTPATGSIMLYPYAEVVANTSNRYDPLFEPNIVNFKPGDTVEDPFFGPINWKVEAQDININTPCYASGESEARLVTMHGAAIGSGATVDKLVNSNNPGKYTNQGGNLPLPGITTVYGPFGYAYHFDTAPAGFFFRKTSTVQPRYASCVGAMLALSSSTSPPPLRST